jgi:hypothetical protein
MITIQRKVKFGQKGRKKKASSQAAVGRVPRVARLMALAIRFDQMIRDGVVADQAELARLGRVTRARLTQIMNLLVLAPDIQEGLLYFVEVRGRTGLTERQLRPLSATPDWGKQRRKWQGLRTPR